MKSYTEFISIASNPEYNYGMFDYIMEQKGDIEVHGTVIKHSDIRKIRRFIVNTNDYNTSKVSEMINNNTGNINRVIRIVEDYEKIKLQQE